MALIDKMHDMYKNDPVSIYITGILESAAENIEKGERELDKNRLLGFADFYLGIFEKELGLVGEGSDSDRRTAVKVKLLTRGEVSLEGAAKICEEYIKWHRFTYSAKDRELIIEFGEDENTEVINGLFSTLEEYLPAHILLSGKYFIRTHGEAADYTHGYMRSYTHAEIRKRTII